MEIVYNKHMKAPRYNWLLIFFIFWFSLQGLTAAVLSVCVQEDLSRHHDRFMMVDDHHHDACHQKANNNITNQLLDNLPCDDTSCDAYGNIPILSSYTASILTNNTTVTTLYHSDFVSFVPGQPQRPPLSSSL